MARGFSRSYDSQEAAITSQPLQHAPSSASLVLFLVGACAKDPTQRSLCRRRGRRKQENRHKVVTSAQYLHEVDCTIAVCLFLVVFPLAPQVWVECQGQPAHDSPSRPPYAWRRRATCPVCARPLPVPLSAPAVATTAPSEQHLARGNAATARRAAKKKGSNRKAHPPSASRVSYPSLDGAGGAPTAPPLLSPSYCRRRWS